MTRLRRPVDQDDALAKFDGVSKSKGEASGQLFDAGERLDFPDSRTAAVLLALKMRKQLGGAKEDRKLVTPAE